MDLVPGQNSPLRSPTVSVRSSFASDGAAVDFAAFVLGADGQVADDSAMVFYNQPSAPGVALRDASEGRFDVYTDLLPHGTTRIALTAVVGDDATFADVPRLTASAACGRDEWTFTVPTAASNMRSLVLFEIYLRDGTWKIRAVGQGFEGGLAVIATGYGVEIAEPSSEPAPPPVPVPPVAAAPPPRTIAPWRRRLKGIGSSDAALVMEADAALERAGTEAIAARTILCLDISEAMLPSLEDGSVATLAARMSALAFRLDPEGVLDVLLFGRFAHSFGGLTTARASGFARGVLDDFGTESARNFAPAARRVADMAGNGPCLLVVAAAGAPDDAALVEPFSPGVFRATVSLDSVSIETPVGNHSERNTDAGFDFQPGFGQMRGAWAREQSCLSPSGMSDGQFYDRLLRNWPRWIAGERDAFAS
jgi:stress response protein SCP2